MADAAPRPAEPRNELLELLARARAHVESEELPAAIACLEKALDLEPGDVRVRRRLAALLGAVGERDRALSIWTGLLEEEPEEAHRRLARLHEAGGDVASAVGHWQALLELGGDAELPHTRLARLHEQLGDLETAIRHWRALLDISDDAAEVHTRLARLHEETGEAGSAIVHWRALLGLTDDPSLPHKRLARLHQESGDPESAIGHWRALLELPGDPAGPNAQIAHLYEALGDDESARAHWRALLELPAEPAVRRAAVTRCLPEIAAGYAKPARVLRVDAGGQEEFSTIQEAIAAAAASDDGRRVEIQIAPGRYRERVVIPHEASPLILRGLGETPEEVIVESQLMSQDPFVDPEGLDSGPMKDFRSATLFVGSDDHIVSNLALVNSRVQLFNETGGLPAARVDGDRVTFSDVVFLNWGSDTLAAVWGRQFYYRCRVESRSKGTDFVYGTARAVFRECRLQITQSLLQLVAHARSGAKQLHRRSYALLTHRAAGPREERTGGGFVFSQCRVDTGPGTRMFLGRPLLSDGRIVFTRCWLGEGIHPEGWTVKGVIEDRETSFFAEFDNQGPGADTGRRVGWAHQLEEEAARAFQAKEFLRDPEGETDPWLAYVLTLMQEPD